VKTLIIIDAQNGVSEKDTGPCQATTRFWPEFIGMSIEREKAGLRVSKMRRASY
jgi:hypothetical protein